jgi:hypothetical protein
VIKPGDSANSKLIQLVAGVLKDAVMPPEGERLSKEQVGLLRAWIDQGANWPEGVQLPQHLPRRWQSPITGRFS